MYEKLMRFKVIKDDRVFDAYLDERLSFVDNFKLLENILDTSSNYYKVYDPNKKLFLNTSVPIEEFSISNYMMMYLY